MSLYSNWKLTFDPAGTPLVLLDHGDKLDSELRFPLKKGLEVVDIPYAAAPFLRPTGNAVVTIQFETWTDKTTDALARREVMESLVALATKARKPLKLEIKGITDRHWLFANSYVQEYNPGRWLEAPRPRLVKGWQITATGLAQVGP